MRSSWFFKTVCFILSKYFLTSSFKKYLKVFALEKAYFTARWVPLFFRQAYVWKINWRSKTGSKTFIIAWCITRSVNGTTLIMRSFGSKILNCTYWLKIVGFDFRFFWTFKRFSFTLRANFWTTVFLFYFCGLLTRQDVCFHNQQFYQKGISPASLLFSVIYIFVDLHLIFFSYSPNLDNFNCFWIYYSINSSNLFVHKI